MSGILSEVDRKEYEKEEEESDKGDLKAYQKSENEHLQRSLVNKLHSSKIIAKTRRLVENNNRLFGPKKRGRPRKKKVFDIKHGYTNRSDTLTTKSERP